MPLRSSTIRRIPPLAETCVVMAGVHGTCPKKHQRRLTGIDGTVRPERRDVCDLARHELGSARRAVLAFEEHEPAPRESLVGLRAVAFPVVMTAGQVILEAYLSGVDDCCAKKDITLGEAIVEREVLVADGILLLSNASFVTRLLKVCKAA